MAEKRMFSNKVIGSDAFLEMPDSTQNLYFHLSMYADDDGFVDKPKSIMRMTGKKEDDLKLLIVKSFIIPFDSGIIVIKHWRLNNYLRSDRYKETQYLQEKKELVINQNGEYELGRPVGIPSVTTNILLSNSNLNSNNKSTNKGDARGKEKHKYGEYKNVLLTDDELSKLQEEYGEQETSNAIKFLDEYTEMKGYKCKCSYLAMRKWVFQALKEQNQRQKPQQKKDAFMDTLQAMWDEEEKGEM
jgi:hypothetical protein